MRQHLIIDLLQSATLIKASPMDLQYTAGPAPEIPRHLPTVT